MGSLPHSHSAAARDPSDERADDTAVEDTPEGLIEYVRFRGLSCDSEVVERIDRALGRTNNDHNLGLLYIARALALQGRGNPLAPAAAARNAVSHLVTAGEMQSAAFAAAMAAVFLDQTDEPIAAMDHAVDALVMLGDPGIEVSEAPLGIEGGRALLALSGFFMRISAFRLATETAARSFESTQHSIDLPMDSVAFSAGYVAAEAAHTAENDVERERYVAQAMKPIDWLSEHGTSAVSRAVMADGLRAETRHALNESDRDIDLEGAARLYEFTPPDLVAWHRLVRASSAHANGNLTSAIALFTQAIPGLEASSDNHCLVRALRGRGEARAKAGDFRGAYADAADVARRTRSWQLSQVGRLAFQLARRADLERSTTELQRTVARLANDIDNDATTGVNSRRWLERRLDELTNSDGFGSALMCDIDHFKNVNDTYGHHTGDEVLLEFGSLLHEIAGDADIARFGGEEFVIVLTGSDRTIGVEAAERLRRSVEAHDWSHIAPGLHLTISCGVTHGQLRNVRELLIAADDALLDAKHRGRNIVMTSSGAAAN